MGPELALYELLVPCQWNNGTPIRTRHHKEWDRKVRKVSGGMTIFSPVMGQWVTDDDTLFEDRMIPVRIYCTQREMEKIVNITIQHYEQLAVMYYTISPACTVAAATEEQVNNFVHP